MNYIEILDKIKSDAPLSQQEMEGILAWLLSDEGRRSVERDVLADWNSFETTETYDYQTLLDKVNSRIGDRQPARKARFPKKYIRYAVEAAAVVALVAGISYFAADRRVEPVPYTTGELAPEKVEIYNPKGLRTTVTLPDNTRVTLNADSRITYLKDFQPGRRAVELEGEAYFDVARDEARPFVVHANEAQLTVLGTSFNVRSYPESRFIETTLVEGSVRVGAGRREVVLKPGHQSSIDKASQENMVREVDVESATGWMEGRLYFRQTPFDEFAVILERTFNVNIVVENSLLLRKNFTGKFEHNEGIEQILEVLNLSVGSTTVYDKETNTVTIR